mmetsp:Transcript_28404/g.79901  ORF Transcript_28404/g.79901 Transcript_28404/m.79901 type:complete len:229 (-) Transcript_28404:3880-4566(-)
MAMTVSTMLEPARTCSSASDDRFSNAEHAASRRSTSSRKEVMALTSRMMPPCDEISILDSWSMLKWERARQALSWMSALCENMARALTIMSIPSVSAMLKLTCRFSVDASNARMAHPFSWMISCCSCSTMQSMTSTMTPNWTTSSLYSTDRLSMTSKNWAINSAFCTSHSMTKSRMHMIRSMSLSDIWIGFSRIACRIPERAPEPVDWTAELKGVPSPRYCPMIATTA